MNILYITYDGITDHIGQSQVAPYLIGLAAKGHRITLLSAEKMERSEIIEKYLKIFAQAGIEWKYVAYHKRPAVLSSVYDVFRMQQLASRLIAKNKVDVVHTRSYVPALIGLHLKKKRRVKFIFDMRDFWADACKEIKRFDVENSRVHKVVYNFFKRKEKEFMEYADHIISLSEAGKKVMESWKKDGMEIKAPITVIPCCADFSFFDRGRLHKEKYEAWRKKLGLSQEDFVLNYLGSLGPSYLTDEMMDVFKVLLTKKSNAKFLIVANNDHHIAKEAAQRKGIDPARIIVTKGNKEDVPYLISQADLSLFFIIPSFAKQACSPTKLAELFAMNVPVISNTKVGDLDLILDLEINNSTVVRSFDEEEYNYALDRVLSRLKNNKISIREASARFTLECGVASYDNVYRSLTN